MTKRCRIYQIDLRGPGKGFVFLPLSITRLKGKEPLQNWYRCVFDGEHGCNSLEEIFSRFQDGHGPEGYSGWSLSVSDVVELYDAQGSAFYFCDNFSFEILDWQEGNTDGSETLGQ